MAASALTIGTLHSCVSVHTSGSFTPPTRTPSACTAPIAVRTAVSTSACRSWKKCASGTAARRPVTGASSPPTTSSTGRGLEVGSAPSCPAIAVNSSAASVTVAASGPMWSIVHDSSITPARLTRPYVGLSPTTPQQAAGSRIEPPVSLPIAPATSPAATAAAEPLDEPPAAWPGFHGFCTSPW